MDESDAASDVHKINLINITNLADGEFKVRLLYSLLKQ